jgi:hypothetical protein
LVAGRVVSFCRGAVNRIGDGSRRRRGRRLYGTLCWALPVILFPSLSLSFAHARARRLIKPSIAQLPCCVVMSLAAKQQRASRSCMMLGKLEMLSFLSLWRCRVTTNHHTTAPAAKGSNSWPMPITDVTTASSPTVPRLLPDVNSFFLLLLL